MSATTHQRRSSSVTLLFAHAVFTVKHRRRVISDRVRNALLAAAHAACAELGVLLVEANGEADHLHCMFPHGPEISIARIVQKVKTATSRAVRKRAFPEVARKLRGDHFWSPSYFVVSCGGAPIDVVRKYIETQNADGLARPS
jgi:putative transposase